VLLSAPLLAIAWARRRRLAVQALPVLVLFAAVAIAFLPVPALLQTAAVGAAALAFAAHLVLGGRHPSDLGAAAACTTLLYLALAMAIAGGFLFYALGDYAGACLVWETGTVSGLGNAFRNGESVLGFARRQLLWSSGLLSTGDASFFYGAPTYALVNGLGFSTATLRLAAALCALLAVAVAFLLARRFFGNIAGAATALALTSSVSFVYHGRYGVAMSATFLAVLLAFLAVWVVLDRERHAWWMGAVAGASLYLATLQYATGRVVALLLLGFAVVFSIARRERFRPRRLAGLAALWPGCGRRLGDAGTARGASRAARGSRRAVLRLQQQPAQLRHRARPNARDGDLERQARSAAEHAAAHVAAARSAPGALVGASRTGGGRHV
jgi:hypothetical protein